MICSRFEVSGWNIEVLINDTEDYDIEFILNRLKSTGCTYSQAICAYNTIKDGANNVGFTYCNYFNKDGIIFIGNHDNAPQLINTIAHESRHLQQYLANYYGLDQNSEAVCYLLGFIAQKIYSICINNDVI